MLGELLVAAPPLEDEPAPDEVLGDELPAAPLVDMLGELLPAPLVLLPVDMSGDELAPADEEVPPVEDAPEDVLGELLPAAPLVDMLGELLLAAPLVDMLGELLPAASLVDVLGEELLAAPLVDVLGEELLAAPLVDPDISGDELRPGDELVLAPLLLLDCACRSAGRPHPSSAAAAKVARYVLRIDDLLGKRRRGPPPRA